MPHPGWLAGYASDNTLCCIPCFPVWLWGTRYVKTTRLTHDRVFSSCISIQKQAHLKGIPTSLDSAATRISTSVRRFFSSDSGKPVAEGTEVCAADSHLPLPAFLQQPRLLRLQPLGITMGSLGTLPASVSRVTEEDGSTADCIGSIIVDGGGDRRPPHETFVSYDKK